MNCKCIEQVNEKLKAKGLNLRLTGYSIVVTDSDFDTRIHVATDWIDKTKVAKQDLRKPPPVFGAYCPFCGQKAVKEADKFAVTVEEV